jgi:class 3 adenylate cyclase/tetratricopeptide (TPR) repeat protein
MSVPRAVERRIVTVLFADLVGFTALSEQLDAEDVTLVQDAYFDGVRETIARHGGLLEKFVGDAVMAVFGAPRARDDDAERAIRAGLALVAAVERLGASLGLDGLRLRVGINTGEAVYGEATPERGPVTGDAVNVAARLQAAAEPGTVVVGEVTALAAADAVEFEAPASIALKGKRDPVAASVVVGFHPEPSREHALGGLRAPMLGRAEELELLVRAAGSGPRRLLVIAPPGVGKSRLLAELGAVGERSGRRVLRARLRPDRLAPFEAVAQLVRAAGGVEVLPGALARSGTAEGRAAAVCEALAAVIDPAAAGAAEERDVLFAAWLEGLDALTAPAAAVWLVEDVHWAPRDLLAFLAAAGEAPAPAGRLVLASARPVLRETAPDWCTDAELLDLPPLLPADTAALVRELVGKALPPELVARIADRSGGNALFVEELLRSWAGAGVLEPHDGGWRLAAPPEEVPLPPTVQAIYAGQLDDLPGPARNAARRASVAGRRFPLDSFAPLGIEDGREAVAALARRGFVTGPDDDVALGESYAYRHALLRDAGYASLARSDRADLHLRLADWLAGLPDEVLASLAEVVGRHYAAALDNASALAPGVAGRPREEVAAAAAGWFERAAEVAAGLAAWQSARELLERALALTRDGRTLERAGRLTKLAAAAENTTGIGDAEPLLREALDLARAARAEDERAGREGISAAGAELGRLLRAQTHFVEAAQLADELLAEVGAGDDLASGRLLLLRAGAVLNALDDYDGAERDARRGLAAAQAAGDEGLELEARQLVAQVGSERGDDSEEAWLEVEQLARRARRWSVVASAARIRAAMDVDDDPERALARIEDAAELSGSHGLVESGAWCDYVRAEALFAAGRWDDAVATGLRAIEVGEAHAFHRVVVRSWFVLLPIGRARGDDALARQANARFAARKGREPDSRYARVITASAHLHLAAAGLEPRFVPGVDDRLPSFELGHGGPSWLAATGNVVDAWLAAGELAGVERALDRMQASLARNRPSRLAVGTHALLHARLLLAGGEERLAAEEARRALTALPPRAPWWRAQAVRVLEQAGAADEELAAEAAQIERELGIPGTG